MRVWIPSKKVHVKKARPATSCSVSGSTVTPPLDPARRTHMNRSRTKNIPKKTPSRPAAPCKHQAGADPTVRTTSVLYRNMFSTLERNRADVKA
ncbi:hypothetical protein CSUI_008342 [Cystoisospora suis]|uniref:Uncharacterized protein n=1 Tax=Cystoisospora suis TaxID=483139 RepID=A0A2C6KN68_9APIC|nr:hypothetical protein CSUI_008342 [Cystoisospora suis]